MRAKIRPIIFLYRNFDWLLRDYIRRQVKARERPNCTG